MIWGHVLKHVPVDDDDKHFVHIEIHRGASPFNNVKPILTDPFHGAML